MCSSDLSVASSGGQLPLFRQRRHVGGATAEARQHTDLHRNAPTTGLDQGRLIEIAGEALHRIGVVLHHQIIDQAPQGPQLPVLEPLVKNRRRLAIADCWERSSALDLDANHQING